jgi:Cu+-exporting ATPase
MIFGLGYNNALAAGEAPEPWSLLYWMLHGGVILSCLVVMFLLGRPLLRQTAQAVAGRRITVEALFVLSGFGAFGGSILSTIRGSGSVYYEVVSIVLCVYAIGKQIGVVQKGRVGQALAAFRHAFDQAVVKGPDGARIRKPINQLDPGDRILIQPGDPIPVDGHILEGGGYLRETALTGEPVPVRRTAGDRVMAGTWSVDGNLVVCPSTGGQRSIESILQMLERAPQEGSNLQASADRLMQVFVPIVSLTAVGTFAGWLILSDRAWWDGLFNAMAVLLVACPCALGLAMPAGIWGGLYHLGQRGLVGRSGHLIDTLADCDTVVFDKTGTLTEFDLEADTSGFLPGDPARDRLLAAVASAGRHSPHPVSAALGRLAEGSAQVSGFTVCPGEGIRATIDGKRFLIGEISLLNSMGITCPETTVAGSKVVHVGIDHCHAGTLLLSERLRPDAESAMLALKQLGCECHILSGDPAPAQEQIAGIAVEGGLTPDDKARRIQQWVDKGRQVLFVGDGVNDLPAMQASRSALAIDLGSALATEYADGLLVEGRVASLPWAIRHARRLKRNLSGNLRFAIFYNLLGMSLAAAGALLPVVAAFLMVGSSAVVSYRALKVAGLQG